MKLIFGFITTFIAFSSFAETLNCEINLNSESILTTKIQTAPKQKVSIGTRHGISAYVTEKAPSKFLVEAFISSEDLRIYAEGGIKETGENVTASLWSRDQLVDVQCVKFQR